MGFELSRDADGKPYHVCSDDGFAIISRPFNPEEDGWMEDQLDPGDFLAIPSIAYRLALAAAGVGRAAMSLSGPGDCWAWATAITPAAVSPTVAARMPPRRATLLIFMLILPSLPKTSLVF